MTADFRPGTPEPSWRSPLALAASVIGGGVMMLGWIGLVIRWLS